MYPETQRPRRLRGFDYGSSALYFVTMVTRKGACILWDWRSVLAATSRQNGEEFEKPILSECGEAAKHFIDEIEHHYAGIRVEEYTILPNHVHMLIRFGVTAASGRLIAAQTTLPTVIQQLKQAMTKHLGVTVWARTYIDRIVRDDKEAKGLRDYIRINAKDWTRDSLCPKI
ncbi:MAG: transposase [Ruminococcus sp.]|nr:transposase [Ruminococcus sp.]